MRFEFERGRYYIWFDTDTAYCDVCDGGHVHMTWEGVGRLCLRHSVDWMLDDYQSVHNYDLLDNDRK